MYILLLVYLNICLTTRCRRQVSNEEAQAFAAEHGVLYVEASAKTAQVMHSGILISRSALINRDRTFLSSAKSYVSDIYLELCACRVWTKLSCAQ